MPTPEILVAPEMRDELYLPRLEEIKSTLEECYDERLPFHPWPHAERVAERSLYTRGLLVAAGVRTEGIFVTLTAAYGHDAGTYMYMTQDFEDKPATAEEYAMFLTRTALEDAGVDERTIVTVNSIQWPTRAGVPCRTADDLNLCAADVFNTSEDYEDDLLPNMELVHEELTLLSEEKMADEPFTDRQLKLLSKYYAVNLRIAESVHPIFAEQRRRMGANLGKLIVARADASNILPVEFARTLGPDVELAYSDLQAA